MVTTEEITLTAGDKLGRLTLVSRHVPKCLPWKGQGEAQWRCICDCGNDPTITESYLTREFSPVRACAECNKNKKKNKGSSEPKLINHAQFEPIVGNKPIFGALCGRLTLLYPVDEERWRCVCKCGNISDYKQKLLMHTKNPIRRCVDCQRTK